jgi:two-component system phosphate regulon sensor histidine kinase PhoR
MSRPIKHSMTFTVALMATSIILLLVLQAFWLNSVYNDQRRDLERDVSILFGNTVIEMSDSLMQQSIKALPTGDSTGKVKHRIRVDTQIVADSAHGTFVKRAYRDSNRNIRVFLYSDKSHDSIRHYLRPLMDQFRERPPTQAFTIRLTGDSLRINDIKRKFHYALIDAGIRLPDGTIRVTAAGGRPEKRKDTIFTPTGAFTAEFVNIKWIVLKKITPQIAFALLLTLITSASFIIMYQNLRAQHRLMILKNEFISNVTHELKTPIATVSVALEALKNFSGMDNPRLTHEYLDIAQHELNRLTVLTDKVLTASLLDEHGMTMEVASVDLEKIISDVIFAMGPVFEKKDGSIKFLKTGSDFALRGNHVHLTNVVYNLIDNAIKYSASKLEVVVSLNDHGDRISFSVKDSGNGIPREYQSKIFEKFFRMPTGDVHNVKGHGLGLSYVASVIGKHGGTIEVLSKPEAGSTFTVIIPRKDL